MPLGLPHFRFFLPVRSTPWLALTRRAGCARVLVFYSGVRRLISVFFYLWRAEVQLLRGLLLRVRVEMGDPTPTSLQPYPGITSFTPAVDTSLIYVSIHKIRISPAACALNFHHPRPPR